MVLEVGILAPIFSLPDENEEVHHLQDYIGKTVLLYFYPKDDTPGCTTEACNFRDDYSAYQEAGVVILGVSPDSPKMHTKFKAKYDLPFTLLVDQDHAIAELYGVWGEKSMYGRKYMGIIRSHFVIDEAGKIIDARVKVKPDDSVKTAIQALEDG